MRAVFLFLGLFLVVGQAQAQVTPPAASQPAAANPPTKQGATRDLTTIPLGKGLPVIVRVGLYFQEVTALDENDGMFTGTVDMRLRWEDPRLRYPAKETLRGFREYQGAKATEKLTSIWTPGVAFANIKGEPSYQITNFRIYPDGWVEVMQRTTAQFSINLDTSNFPFDKQVLRIEVNLRGGTTKEAALVFLQEDLDFSNSAKDIKIDGWDVGLVNLKRATRQGWYGSSHSSVIIGLEVIRDSAQTVATIFIPLLASLLIPLLAIWMNRTEDGEFQIDAFELANVIVGGLFAVIALNFTVNGDYKVIASGDNAVTRLFGLNYATLALSLVIVVVLYRYNLPMRLFGRYVQEQTFTYISWAVPALAFGIAATFLMIAYV